LAFNRIVVLRYRSHLESRQLAPGTINLRLGAVRRLAYEAADCGLLSADLAAGFHSGGWPGALHKAIEVSLAQRKSTAEYASLYAIAHFYADLGDKDHAFEWLNTAYQEQRHIAGQPPDRLHDGFPALRSALHRTGAQNWISAIVTIAAFFSEFHLRIRDCRNRVIGQTGSPLNNS
jgi:hypothetical protein